jgi:histidinol-phosphate phosphatase family protein
MAGKAAVFLDRDGTINRDVPYCSSPDQFELLPGAADGISLLNEAGFKVIVVTNQSGIGRGYFSAETLALIHDRMKTMLAAHGAHVDAVYYCPHHPDDHCHCRKPQPQMVTRAASDMDLDLQRSYVVGDSEIDVEMGKKVGCKATVRIASMNHPLADQTVPSILEAAKWVVDQEGGRI